MDRGLTALALEAGFLAAAGEVVTNFCTTREKELIEEEVW